MRLSLIVWLAVCIGVVQGGDFSGTSWLVRGASLRLRHSAEPQAPGTSIDARVTVPEDGKLAFQVELKHGQKAFIGAAVLPKQGYFDFTGHTVLACDVENRSA